MNDLLARRTTQDGYLPHSSPPAHARPAMN